MGRTNWNTPPKNKKYVSKTHAWGYGGRDLSRKPPIDPVSKIRYFGLMFKDLQGFQDYDVIEYSLGYKKFMEQTKKKNMMWVKLVHPTDPKKVYKRWLKKQK